jgi:hypothetical protein
MIEVAGVGNFLFLQPGVRAGNCRGDHFVVPGVLAGFHERMQQDRLAVSKPRLHRAGRPERHHEAERLHRRERFQVAPADEAVVIARPRGPLVLRVAHDSGGAEFSDREFRDGARLLRGEDDPSLDVLPRVIAPAVALADVDQLRGHIRGLAVLREDDRRCSVARNPRGPSMLDLAELRLFDIPGRARPLRSVLDLSVGG